MVSWATWPMRLRGRRNTYPAYPPRHCFGRSSLPLVSLLGTEQANGCLMTLQRRPVSVGRSATSTSVGITLNQAGRASHGLQPWFSGRAANQGSVVPRSRLGLAEPR